MASDSSTTSSVLDISDASFPAEVLERSGAVLVDVWAAWCGPCRLMAPLMGWAASTYAGRLNVAKLEADANPLNRDAYGVQGLPTLLLFRDGALVARHEGAMGQAQLQAFLDAHL
jgi:thioredoxin 1